MSASDTVSAFIQAWNDIDFDRVMAMLSDDIEYHNIPMPILIGKPAVRAFIDGLGEPDSVHWEVHHIAENANVVMTERTDSFVFNGKTLRVRVMGVFELEGELIAKWRDYFDMAEFQVQMAELT